MHEPLTNLRKVIFVQCAQGMPRIGGVARAAWRVDAARRLRQDLHRGQRGHRSRERRCGVLVARLSLQPDRRRAHRALSLGRPWAEVRRARRGVDAPDRRHAQALGAAARAAGARVHGARARHLGGARSCRRSRRSRPGTAIRSATGPTTGRPSRAAPSRASGRRTAPRPSRAAAAACTPETPVRDVEGKK